MAKESEIGNTFHQVVEIARRINHKHTQWREAIMRDKRPRRDGSSSGTSFGSRGRFRLSSPHQLEV